MLPRCSETVGIPFTTIIVFENMKLKASLIELLNQMRTSNNPEEKAPHFKFSKLERLIINQFSSHFYRSNVIESVYNDPDYMI